MSSPLPVEYRGVTLGVIQVAFLERKVFCCLITSWRAASFLSPLLLGVLLVFSRHLASHVFFKGLLLNRVLLARVSYSHQQRSDISSCSGGSSAAQNDGHFLSLQQELKL